MMRLTTPIDIPKAGFSIAHTDRVMLVGSCFADEVGARFAQGGFDTLANPWGTLYNPASIHAQMAGAMQRAEWGGDTFFRDAASGLWHSWMHHTRFSAPTGGLLAERCRAATAEAGDALREADVLIVTFGTAIVYRLKDGGRLVANCHKQPDGMFVRQWLSVDEIVDDWSALLQLLFAANSRVRVIFTVSPIRHMRDGMHTNQVSKGMLLQAVDELVAAHSRAHYFPAYEIMLDELRDYRFYADDMIHPSPVAVEYIWQRFQDTYFSAATRDAVAKSAKLHRQSQHRPISATK